MLLHGLLIVLLLTWTRLSDAKETRRAIEVYTLCNRGFSYTWDDGPGTHHQEIAQEFEKSGARTTFFVNGDNQSCIYDEDNVRHLRASFEAGHQIASHTWSHASLIGLNDTQIDAEILRLDEALIKILGIRPRLFRPPFGDINGHVIKYIRQKHRKVMVMWSDDSTDAIGGTAKQSWDFYDKFAKTRPDYPALTLSHEISEAGIDALKNGTVVDLVNAGVNLLTTAECIHEDPYEYVGEYGVRDETWHCGDGWALPSLGNSTAI